MGFAQSAIDWNRYMEGLSGKANGKFAVIESKVNPDGSWYRKWSDGWLEQGGNISGINQTAKTITFMKPFRDNKYYINSNRESERIAGWTTAFFLNKTTTTVQIATNNTSTDTDNVWYACGQGA